MQRGRFAQEFLAELMREPRAIRVALLGERARWLRNLKVSGREEVLFEIEMLMRCVELAFSRRHASPGGRAVLGLDFAEEIRAVRDAQHRAASLCRRLTINATEQSFQFRAFLERQAAEDARRPRPSHELMDQRTPEEALYVLRDALRALQGIADQLLRQTYVTYQAFSDFAVLGEHVLLSNKYFRPPGALEFRSEYDRVGSVRLLDLVKRIGDARLRKALALGFLASFRLLRYLRYIPSLPVVAPRRALLVAQLVNDESLSVAHYLSTDIPRLAAGKPEGEVIIAAAGDAAEYLRSGSAQVSAMLALTPVDRSALESTREALSEAARAAASALARSVEPSASAAEIFDGQRARRDRAERLRKDMWLAGQLLRQCLEALFPAMKGEQTRAFESVEALARFTREFRQIGYHLLRAGDHEPFDRFFQSLEALTATAQSPARDRHLYLECRRFLPVVERGLALVTRRAEIVDLNVDPEALEKELERFRHPTESMATPLDSMDPRDAVLEMIGDPIDDFMPDDVVTLAPEEPSSEPFDAESTRRILRREEHD